MRRWPLKFTGLGPFLVGMSQIQTCSGVVTGDGRIKTERGTFEFACENRPPAGAVMTLWVHFKKRTLHATGDAEVKAENDWFKSLPKQPLRTRRILEAERLEINARVAERKRKEEA